MKRSTLIREFKRKFNVYTCFALDYESLNIIHFYIECDNNVYYLVKVTTYVSHSGCDVKISYAYKRSQDAIVEFKCDTLREVIKGVSKYI